MNRVMLCLTCLILAGCGGVMPFARKASDPAEPSGIGLIRPVPRPTGGAAPAPPPGARTVEALDTTTPEQRAAATAPVSGGGSLGVTVASLGDPTRSGFWLETPLVSAEGPGRVVYAKTGKSAQVLLIPIDGPDTAGSRMSLAAMRLIEAPLTGLPEVQVFSGE